MKLNNLSITVNRVTHNLFFYFSRVKVTHPELGFEERNAPPTSQRGRRGAPNLPPPPPTMGTWTPAPRLTNGKAHH